MTPSQNIAKLRADIEKYSLQPFVVYRRAGLHPSSCTQMKKPDWNPTAKVLEALMLTVKVMIKEKQRASNP